METHRLLFSDQPWLTNIEQKELCDGLVHFGLIKFDNKRSLPLKSGGKTDVYINLRDARNDPKAISFITRFFSNPLRRLNVDRFVEVPDSVSCFAAPLSIETGIPYLTIREQSKEGRVSKANVIGSVRYGERVCILDDVITDGASKVIPYQECRKMGLRDIPLVVLVDRQQGWKKKFGELGIGMPVWPGMTLHDVRKHLIVSGVMERCSKDIEDKNPIIVALDGKDWEEILPIVDQLRTTGCIFKVNDLLFDEGFKNLIPDLSVYGRVMADLKGHDIPNTLKNISERLKKNPPWAVTVHGTGGKEMIQAVVETLKGTGTKVLVVTVLTSIDEATSEEIYSRAPIVEVRILADIANRAGADGLVCSPQEAKELREKYPNMTLVVPGIRSEGVDQGDQKRIGTPQGAIASGANHLVMGRQILGAPDPIAEVQRLLKEELKVI
ncbi:MAG: orotidine-5'-phosphate decarboxylase [Minisyncoccia bacterium]